VNGQSQRTADGSIIMVTPDGREWHWNGKYNTVIDFRNDLKVGTLTQSHAVMQGDPDAPSQKLNGKYIKVSDPGYQAALDADRARKQAEKDARNAAAAQAASKQNKDAIADAKDPGGALQRGGTKIIKEDIDSPPRGSGQSGGSSNGSSAAANSAAANANSSATNPVSTTAGSANIKSKPPIAAPVTASPVSAPPVVTPPPASTLTGNASRSQVRAQ